VNSLQIGLIAIGAVVVAALFLLHWWQSRRSERRAAQQAASQAADAAPPLGNLRAASLDPARVAAPADGERIEPKIDVDDAAMWTPSAEWRPQVDAVVPEPDAEPAAPPAPAAAPVPMYVPVAPPPSMAAAPAHPASQAQPAKLLSEWPFDERLHAHASILSLSGEPFDAAPFVAAAGRAQAWVRLFRQSPWESYDPSNVGSVVQLALALPLASRAGPIEAHEIDEWRFVLTELSNTQGCEAQFHGFRDAPQRAAELDGFLAAVDIIPVAYLVKRDSQHWLGTRLRGTLEANGFRLQSDGRFAYHEIESDAVIFYAVDGFERPFTPERLRTENFTALRCTLEPVRLSNPVARFDMYRQSLRALAKLLDADLKTSEGAALDDAEFVAMREDVRKAMDALAAAGVEPGSDTARSLFS